MNLNDLISSADPAGRRTRPGDAALALLVVGVVAMLILPLPTWLLDILITGNISLALLVLLVSLRIGSGSGFSAFPGLLLITTLVRLGLNVSSTRLILLQADAGEVISSFGGFVVGGSLIVGAVVFMIITLIQYLVVARGSERVAEVAARFTLDALPGKQMAIDAEVRAGLLDRAAALRRRAELERECQLYGAMDGAMKFVKGDAIAAILITLVDMGGGLLMGVFIRGMELKEAARVYTQLTIGDGLVSQIPALMISLAAGVVVTRVASEGEDGHLGEQLARQLLARPRSLLLAAGLLALLALVPGMPGLPFALLALGGAAAGVLLLRRERTRQAGDRAAPGSPGSPGQGVPRPIQPTVALELGPGLTEWASPASREGRQLSRLLTWSERLLWEELGVPLSPVQARPGPETLDRGAFRLLVHGAPSGGGQIDPAAALALAPRAALERAGVAPLGEAAMPGVDPPAWRVPVAAAGALTSAGIQVLEPPACLALHLSSALRRAAPELVGIQETQDLLDAVQQARPALVREVIPRRLPLARLTALLRDLLAEEVSIRELGQILEALAALPGDLPAPPRLTEQVRLALARAISHHHAAPDGTLRALELSPAVEELLAGVDEAGEAPLGPEQARDLSQAVRRHLPAASGAAPVVLVTAPRARRPARQMLREDLPDLPVLSRLELSPDLKVEFLARVSLA